MANIITDGSGSSFVVGDYIDRGSFSKVYTLECCLTKKQLAGKFISKEKLVKFGIMNTVWNEIKIHQLLRHPHIVQFLNYIEQEKDIVIILEYCSKYSMIHILHALKTLTVGESKYFMLQIVSAVDYLHKNYIVHRDLKLGNLFVNKNLEIKLGDFGLAIAIEYDGQKRFSRCGTPNYLAPEVINGVGHSFEVDVWALGCILYSMLEGTPPFQGENTTSTYNNILKGKYSFSTRTHPLAKTFISGCLLPDPYQRPTVFQLSSFEFLTCKQIKQEIPAFVFVNDEKLSFSRKRMSQPIVTKEVYPVIEPAHKDHSINGFMKLFNALRHVKKWPESKFGEFLAEHNSAVPLVWVNCWMDYSNSYGFAYQLNNKNCGLIFNDGSKMIHCPQEGCVLYRQSNEPVFVYQTDKIPGTLKKKLRILMTCQSYMNELLVKAHEPTLEDRKQNNEASCTEVFKWFKGDNEVVMLLSNGSVQVNFFSDHTKLILTGYNKTVTIIESIQCMKTLKLDALQTCGCSKNLSTKLHIVLKHICRHLTNTEN